MVNTVRDDEELLNIVQRFYDAAYNRRVMFQGDIEEGFKYYNGELPKKHHRNGSSWTDRTVRDQTQSILAVLRDIFTSNDDVLRLSFKDQLPHAVEKQVTRLVWNAIFEENDGFNLYTAWMFDSLLCKASAVKVYWNEDIQTVTQKFEGVSEEALAALAPNVDEIDAEPNENGTYDGTAAIFIDKSSVKIEFVKFEDFLIDADATSVADARYMCHRIEKTRTEWAELGIEVTKGDDRGLDVNDQYLKSVRDKSYFPLEQIDAEQLQLESVVLYENYIHCTLEGKSGVWRILCSGSRIIEKELMDGFPFAVLRPLPFPGLFYGESIPDITKDLQDANSILMRGTFDNIRDAVDPRYMGLKGAYDKRSLLNRRSGEVIDVNAMDAITTFADRHFDPNAMQMAMQYLQSARDQRTGMSLLAQGMDGNVFKNDNAFSTVQTAMSQALQRIKFIALNFAQGGLRELYQLVYGLLRQHGDQPQTFQIEGQPLELRLADLPDVKDVIYDLAMTTPERQAKAGQTLQLLGMIGQDQLLNGSQLFGLQERVSMYRDLLQLYGLPTSYVKPLAEAQPPQPDPLQEAAKQLAVRKAAAECAVDEATAQLRAAQAADAVTNAHVAVSKAKFDQDHNTARFGLDVKRFNFEQQRAGVNDALSIQKQADTVATNADKQASTEVKNVIEIAAKREDRKGADKNSSGEPRKDK